MTTSPVTIEADVSARRIVPEVPAQIQGDPNDCYPEEPAHAEDLRVTIRVPLRCVGSPDRNGFVRVDITHMVSADDIEACEDALIEAEGL